MNIETEEYKGYIAYYIFGEYCGDRKYTLKIMKDHKLLRNCHGFTCNGAKTEFHRWVDKKLLNKKMEVNNYEEIIKRDFNTTFYF